MNTKECHTCHCVKSVDEFYVHPSNRDGYFGMCKSCFKIKQKTTNHPPLPDLTEKRCVRCRELKPIQHFAKRKSHKDGYQSYCKECSKPNTLHKRFIIWKRNAKVRGLEFGLSLPDLESLPLTCFYTGKQLSLESGFPNTISLDRLNSDLGYVKGNVVLCSSRINVMKMDMPIKEFVLLCKSVSNYFCKNSG